MSDTRGDILISLQFHLAESARLIGLLIDAPEPVKETAPTPAPTPAPAPVQPATDRPAKDILYINEVSEEWNIPVATLRFWIAKGRGGPLHGKRGRRIIYRRSDVEAYIESGFEK